MGRLTRVRVRALVSKNDPWHSSCRSIEEVRRIFEEATEIWRQAGMELDAQVEEWTFEPQVLEDVVRCASRRQDDSSKLGEVTGPSPREMTAIYLHSIGGSSGKVFRPKKTVVIVDETKVSAARTTAHEIGHVFGLEHWLDHPPPEPSDRTPEQLMARTQPGVELLPRDVEWVKERLTSTGLELA